MHNTRSENLDIARRYVNGELTPTEAQKMLGVTRNGIYYWANEYRRSIGETVPTKPRTQPSGKKSPTRMNSTAFPPYQGNN